LSSFVRPRSSAFVCGFDFLGWGERSLEPQMNTDERRWNVGGDGWEPQMEYGWCSLFLLFWKSSDSNLFPPGV